MTDFGWSFLSLLSCFMCISYCIITFHLYIFIWLYFFCSFCACVFGVYLLFQNNDIMLFERPAISPWYVQKMGRQKSTSPIFVRSWYWIMFVGRNMLNKLRPPCMPQFSSLESTLIPNSLIHFYFGFLTHMFNSGLQYICLDDGLFIVRCNSGELCQY